MVSIEELRESEEDDTSELDSLFNSLDRSINGYKYC